MALQALLSEVQPLSALLSLPIQLAYRPGGIPSVLVSDLLLWVYFMLDRFDSQL
ncbi:MAG: hypothetical protein H6Q71_2597 [Firmicutes bacterium]|nr:hypothetical protein [Bacillota bacterium]